MKIGALWWLLLLWWLTGCAALSLRPVQRDHALRKAEVSQKLGVDAPIIDGALAADQAECDALDGKVTGWTATSVVLGAISGGGGLTTVLTDDTTARYVVGGVGIGVAVLTALSAYLATSYSQKYARRCAVNLGGR